MQLCAAQKEDSAPFSSLPSNQTGTFRDFSPCSSTHLLYGAAQVADKGADCVFKTITAPQPIFKEQDLKKKKKKTKDKKGNRNRPTKLEFVHGSLKTRKIYNSLFILDRFIFSSFCNTCSIFSKRREMLISEHVFSCLQLSPTTLFFSENTWSAYLNYIHMCELPCTTAALHCC